ncbi:hypothetical protein LCGC14_2973600, partial [marine sediment metagenome]
MFERQTGLTAGAGAASMSLVRASLTVVAAIVAGLVAAGCGGDTGPTPKAPETMKLTSSAFSDG